MSETETFYVQVDNDTHEVTCDGDEFSCNDCGAEGFTDGYLHDQPGAQAWHNSL